MANILIGIIALAFGLGSGYLIRRYVARKRKDAIEAKTQNLIINAKAKEKEILLSAKDKAIRIIDEAKKDERQRQGEINRLQKRLEQRESLFDKKLLEIESKKQDILEKVEKVNRVKEEVARIREEQMEKLQKIAKLTKEEAKNELLEMTEKEVKEDILGRMKKLQEEGAEELEKKSKEMLSIIIQRCASSHAAETTTSTVDLPSDEMKGRIIGREGRNIKSLEHLTGVEIIVDDTPETITISGFSPIRRQIAKRTLEKLISDGRIHPARIEEYVEQAKKDLAVEIKKAGEEAIYNVGVTGLDPKLVQIIGRLKYRTSYGQNVLNHSIEVAHLSAMLAEDLGADVTIAKKAGLLHDIGKAVDHEVQGTHPEIGRDIAKKFDISDEIIQPILTHHEDAPPTLESVIVKVADAISAARPGARKDTYEHYLQRLEELENIAKQFRGVEKSYAIQAGREVRVFVMPEEVDDLEASKLAKGIADKIEEDLKYPGEIKVNVIREKRITEYAR